MSRFRSGQFRPGKLMLTIAALLALAALVGGCGSSDSTTASTEGGSESASDANIAYLAGVVDANYTPAQEEGLKIGSGGAAIQVYNPEFDPTKQVEQCQDAITSQRFSAIVITPLTNASAIPCAKAAAAADMPLIVDEHALGKDPNDIQPQEEGVDAGVIYPPETFAKYTWELIQEGCGQLDPCEVVMEFSFEGDPLFEETIDYVKEQSEGTPIKVVATYESQYDPSQTTEKLRDILLANPGTDVVTFANDPTAVAGAQVIKSAGKEKSIKVIGEGGTADGAKAIENGTMFATIAVLPRTASEIEGEMAAKAIAGEKIDPLGVNGFEVGKIHGGVTKQNVDQFEPEW